MTLKKHVDYIQNLLNKGPRSDDSRWSDRLVAHTLKVMRAKLINIKLNKYDYIAEENYSKICVPLVPYDITNNCVVPEDITCEILRSTCKLPKSIVTKWGSLLEVSSIDGTIFDNVSRVSNSLSQYSIASKKINTSWYELDGYLFFPNNNKMKLVIARNLWEDPEDASNFCTESPSCVQYQSSDFSIDSELIEPMYRMTLEYLLNLTMNSPEDNLSNTRSVENVRMEDPNERT